MREPPARGLGEGRGESLAVALVEGVGMGHKRVEVKGRELLVGKGQDVSAFYFYALSRTYCNKRRTV